MPEGEPITGGYPGPLAALEPFELIEDVVVVLVFDMAIDEPLNRGAL